MNSLLRVKNLKVPQLARLYAIFHLHGELHNSANITIPLQKSSTMNSSRANSFSSSISSRPPSVSSRTTSNGSFSSSVGYGNRPASYHNSRPQTSMAFNQSTMSRPGSSIPKTRPATSMDNHSSDEDISTVRKNKGMQNMSSLDPSTEFPEQMNLQCKKTRVTKSLKSLNSQSSLNRNRDTSVSTALSRLHIQEFNPASELGYEAFTNTMKPPQRKVESHIPSITNGIRNMRIDSNERALVLFQTSKDSLVAPKTPSHIPVLSKVEARNLTPVTPCRAINHSPTKTPFLSKDSNITAFTAWDVDARIDKMESMYSELKNTMSDTSLQRKTLEEAQEVYKSRSKLALSGAQNTWC